MILLILGIVLVVLVFTIAIWYGWDNDGVVGAFMSLFPATLISGIITGVLFFVSFLVTMNADAYTAVLTTERELRVLDTGNETNGKFFLGSGYLSSGPSYTYIVKESDGGFSLNSIESYRARVYETTDGSEPRIVTGKVRPTNTLWSILPVGMMTEFFVPEGTVQAPGYEVSVGNNE